MGYQRAQLKLKAKQAMKQSRSGPRLTTLLYVVVMGVAAWALNALAALLTGMNVWSDLIMMFNERWLEDPEYMLQYLYWVGGGRFMVSMMAYGLVSGLLTFILTSLMTAGYNNYCLSIVRGEEPQMSRIFSGFAKAFSVLGAKLLAGVFIFLWTLLFCVAALIVLLLFLLLSTAMSVVILDEVVAAMMIVVTFAVYIGVGLGVFWATLRYSMVDFLVMDQGLSGMEAIRESKRLMQGNVGKLFVLYLSFIGWQLLRYSLCIAGFAIMLGGTVAMTGTALRPGSVSYDALEIQLMVVVIAWLLLLAGVFFAWLFNIWLQPYVTGSVAAFYDWTRGAVPPPAAPQGWNAGPQDLHYTWTDGRGGSGTGTGSGPQSGGPDGGWGSGGWGGGSGPSSAGSERKDQGGSARREPRDDPWEC